MTRRDFQLIARTVKGRRDSYNPSWDPNLFRALDDVSRDLADSLAGTNPRFDRARFLRESGVGYPPNAVVQPPAVGDSYTGHDADGNLTTGGRA